MKKYAVFYFAFVCLFFCCESVAKPRIGFGPPTIPFQESDPSEFVNHPELWPELAKNSELYLALDGQLISAGNWLKRLDVKKFVEMLKTQNLKLGIEYSLWGDKECEKMEQGVYSANRMIYHILDRIYAEGGSVYSLHLDGADARMMKGNHRLAEQGLTLEEYTEVILSFFQTVHKKYPDIKIGFIIDPKGWDYDKDSPCFFNIGSTANTGIYLEDLINAVYNKFKEHNEPIGFISLDCPYPYYKYERSYDHKQDVDCPAAIFRLQEWCKERNLPLMPIVNTEPRHSKPLEELTPEEILDTNRAYREDCFKYIRALHADGINPEWILLESWYAVPTKNVPENEEGSFFHTTNECIKLINELYGD